MNIKELHKKLMGITSIESFEGIEEALEEFNPENHEYQEPVWFDQGHMDYPAREFFENNFDMNAVVTSSHCTFGDGPFLGHRYYKDIHTAFDSEIRMSLSGIFYLWRDSEGGSFHPELFPLLKAQSMELAALIENVTSPGSKSDFSEIVTLLERLKERHFSTFTTIQDHILSWACQLPLYAPRHSNPPEEYSMSFGKSFFEIDLRNYPEFAWALLKLPPSDWGI